MAVNSGLLVPSLNPSGHAERLVKKWAETSAAELELLLESL